MINNFANFPSLNYLLENQHNKNFSDDIRGSTITHLENMMKTFTNYLKAGHAMEWTGSKILVWNMELLKYGMNDCINGLERIFHTCSF